MPDLPMLGKWIMELGLGLFVIGGILFLGAKFAFLGKLPGDIRIEREHFSFYFPLASGLLVSAVLSILFRIISRFK